jgi:hypothetical protein
MGEAAALDEGEIGARAVLLPLGDDELAVAERLDDAARRTAEIGRGAQPPMAEGHLIAPRIAGMRAHQDGGGLPRRRDAGAQAPVALVVGLHAVGDEGAVDRRGIELDDDGARGEPRLQRAGGVGAGGEIVDGAGDGPEGAAAGKGGRGRAGGGRLIRVASRQLPLRQAREQVLAGHQPLPHAV